MCAARVEAGGGRRFDAKEATRLRRINARESADLANAFVSPKFMSAMYDFNTKRKKTQLALLHGGQDDAAAVEARGCDPQPHELKSQKTGSVSERWAQVKSIGL